MPCARLGDSTPLRLVRVDGYRWFAEASGDGASPPTRHRHREGRRRQRLPMSCRHRTGRRLCPIPDFGTRSFRAKTTAAVAARAACPTVASHLVASQVDPHFRLTHRRYPLPPEADILTRSAYPRPRSFCGRCTPLGASVLTQPPSPLAGGSLYDPLRCSERDSPAGAGTGRCVTRQGQASAHVGT